MNKIVKGKDGKLYNGKGTKGGLTVQPKTASQNINKVFIESAKTVRNIKAVGDLTDGEYEILSLEGEVVIDGVKYAESNYGVLVNMSEREHPNNPDFIYDVDGKQSSVNASGRPSGFKDLTIKQYLDTGNTEMTKEIETVFMSGGCGAFAVAMKETYPHLNIVGDVWEDNDFVEFVDHMFVVDSITNKAYDIRGEYADSDALTNHDAETKLFYDNPEYGDAEKQPYRNFTMSEALTYLEDGFQIARVSREDIEVAKQIIKQLKPRNNWL